jgi:phosphatidyl-myo-inositol dimannoside synthase
MTGNAEPENAKSFDSGFPQRIRRFGFILHVAHGYRATALDRLREYLCWSIAAIWLIYKERPDLIMIGEFSPTTWVPMLMKQLFGIPYVLFTYAEELTYITGRPFYLRLLKRLLWNADGIVTVSNYTKKILEGLGAPPERIHKVLPAVGTDKVHVDAETVATLQAKYSLAGHPILLTVGRLVERKGHATVIQALPSIAKAFPAIRYVIVGAGPQEQKLRQLVFDLNLEEYVIFVGQVDDKELSAWYEICDIFVMPHRQLHYSRDTEGCPTVFLEAGAHGKPVIGGMDGGVSDAILHTRTGYIIDGTSLVELMEKVNDLLDNPELADKMGAEGYAYAAALDPVSRGLQVWNLCLNLAKK